VSQEHNRFYSLQANIVNRNPARTPNSVVLISIMSHVEYILNNLSCTGTVPELYRNCTGTLTRLATSAAYVTSCVLYVSCRVSRIVPELYRNCTGIVPLVTKMYPFLYLLCNCFCILFVTKFSAYVSGFWHRVTFYVTDSPLYVPYEYSCVTNF
jgi:hypothetical protein